MFYNSLPISTNSDTNNHNLLLNRQQAADLLGVACNTLAVWHCNKRYKLPVVKVGRLVKYRMSDLLDFIENNTF